MSSPSDPFRSRPRRADRAIEDDGGEVSCGGDGIDHFDRLPDSIILVIFNMIGDVKALGRCCVVSRRFHELVPLVDNVIVRVDCVISDDPSPSSPSAAVAGYKARGIFSQFARLVYGGIVKPLQAIGQVLSKRAPDSSSSSSVSSASEVSHHSPTEVLKNFKEIRSLKIELPAGELGLDEGILLKWKANFGSTLDSCVILGASSSSSKSQNPNFTDSSDPSGTEDNGSIPESFYTNGSLKLRVVWTISSLIAASARHYLLQPIISDHETLEGLDLTDADGQGVLKMDKLQLKELRVKPVSASSSSQRTLVPALRMKLWYAPELEIPGGIVLKGATLVAIRPSEAKGGENWANRGSSDGGCWVSDAFEEPYRTAAKMLVKRRTYSLEMNSF